MIYGWVAEKVTKIMSFQIEVRSNLGNETEMFGIEAVRVFLLCVEPCKAVDLFMPMVSDSCVSGGRKSNW